MIKLIDYINAGYTFICIDTVQEEEIIKNIKDEIPNRNVYTWDATGKVVDTDSNKVLEKINDPLKLIDFIAKDRRKDENENNLEIYFLKDFSEFLKNHEISRTFKNNIGIFEKLDKIIIFLYTHEDIGAIPKIFHGKLIEYNDQDFNVPDIDRIVSIYENIYTATYNKKLSNGNNFDEDFSILSHLLGLTKNQVINIISLSLAIYNKLDREFMQKERAKLLNKSAFLEIFDHTPVDDLCGMENLKKYINNRKEKFIYNTNFAGKPSGLILVGPSGTGKSLSAKTIASIFNITLIRLNIGNLKGGVVGKTEENTRNALKTIKSIAPVVVWMDEFEKSYSGLSSSHATDGGTTANMVSLLLTAMQDFKDQNIPVYWVATVNDISHLVNNSQGAILRRFDDIFYVNYPNLKTKEKILNLMNKKYDINIPKNYVSKMQNWTGAEIEKFVINSKYDGIEESFKEIKPIYYQTINSINAKEKEWIANNTRSVEEQDENIENKTEIYQESSASSPRIKVQK